MSRAMRCVKNSFGGIPDQPRRPAGLPAYRAQQRVLLPRVRGRGTPRHAPAAPRRRAPAVPAARPRARAASRRIGSRRCGRCAVSRQPEVPPGSAAGRAAAAPDARGDRRHGRKLLLGEEARGVRQSQPAIDHLAGLAVPGRRIALGQHVVAGVAIRHRDQDRTAPPRCRSGSCWNTSVDARGGRAACERDPTRRCCSTRRLCRQVATSPVRDRQALACWEALSGKYSGPVRRIR